MEIEQEHKVLVVSQKPPYPIVDGGCFAMAKFAELLQGTFGEVFYFALATPKHPFHSDALPEYWHPGQNFHIAQINTNVQPKDIVQFVKGGSLRLNRFYDQEIESSITELIKREEINTVFFESIYASVYLERIRKETGARCIIRSHNTEFKIWEDILDGQNPGIKKTVLTKETKRLKKIEADLYKNADAVIFISPIDQNNFTNVLEDTPTLILPVQLDKVSTLPRDPHDPMRLYHLGAMDWMPNEEGINFMIRNIIPEMTGSKLPVEFHFAGKSMPDRFFDFASEQVHIYPEIADAQYFIDDKDVLVVPINAGSGIRIKALEAMAMGKPVITTATGLLGIPAENGSEVLVAETPKEWVHAVKFLLDADNYQKISKNAKKFIQKNYSFEVLNKMLSEFLANL